MEVKGIRILDKKDGVLSVELIDILKEIKRPNELHWAILFLDGMPNPKEGPFIMPLIEKINESENGLMVNWEELLILSSKFHQIYESVIIGCKDKKLLRNFDNDKEMYESCNITMDLVDCAFWQIFSKDLELIDRLFKKFKNTESLTPDNFDKV